jgi:hypothetical protein
MHIGRIREKMLDCLQILLGLDQMARVQVDAAAQ